MYHNHKIICNNNNIYEEEVCSFILLVHTHIHTYTHTLIHTHITCEEKKSETVRDANVVKEI